MYIQKSSHWIPVLIISTLLFAGCIGSPSQPKAEDFNDKPEIQLFTSIPPDNGGLIPAGGNGESSSFKLEKASLITQIQTVHINFMKGVVPGQISLKDSNGNIYGPWQAQGYSMAGVENARWVCSLSFVLKPGTYTIIDSDASTWTPNAYNEDPSIRLPGMVWVLGKQ